MKLALSFALVLSLVACEKKKETPAAPPAPASAAPASASAAPAAAPTPPAADQPPAPTGDGLKIPVPAYKVGDKETKKEDMTMKMQVEAAPGKKMEIDVAKQAEETREVLAVDSAGVMTKVKISYTTIKDTQSMGGQSKDKPSPVAGKSYVVTWDGKEVTATREDGSALAGEELEEVLDDQKDLGNVDGIDQIVASKVWKTGEKVVITAEELAKVNASQRSKRDGSKEVLAAMELTLTGVDGGVASFDMHMVMDIKNPKGDMKVDLTGAVKLDAATGRLVEIAGAGPIEGNMGAPVTGTMTMKEMVTH